MSFVFPTFLTSDWQLCLFSTSHFLIVSIAYKRQSHCDFFFLFHYRDAAIVISFLFSLTAMFYYQLLTAVVPFSLLQPTVVASLWCPLHPVILIVSTALICFCLYSTFLHILILHYSHRVGVFTRGSRPLEEVSCSFLFGYFRVPNLIVFTSSLLFSLSRVFWDLFFPIIFLLSIVSLLYI